MHTIHNTKQSGEIILKLNYYWFRIKLGALFISATILILFVESKSPKLENVLFFVWELFGPYAHLQKGEMSVRGG